MAKSKGIFAPTNRKGVQRSTYLQQVSSTLAREEATPEALQHSWYAKGGQLVLNRIEAEKRGDVIRALYYKVRVQLWHIQSAVIERKEARIMELQGRRRALQVRNGRAGVKLRSGRF
jgi:hypothetical protein